jgi:hypothetical protein
MTKVLEGLIERQIQSIKMMGGYDGAQKVKISFFETVDLEPVDSQKESRLKKREYCFTSDHLPTVNFTQAMRDLLPHALEINEIDLKGNTDQYTVLEVKITGDIFMNQGRVQLAIGKRVKKAKKVVKFGLTPQIELTEKSVYPAWKELKSAIEKAMERAWGYFNGEHYDDNMQTSFDFAAPAELKKKLKVGKREKTEEKVKGIEVEKPVDLVEEPLAATGKKSEAKNGKVNGKNHQSVDMKILGTDNKLIGIPGTSFESAAG